MTANRGQEDGMSNAGTRKRDRSGKRPPISANVHESTGRGGKSGAVRERAILALLSEPTIAKAAAKSGVDESTLRRWMAADEAFRASYAEARQATFEAGMGRIQALGAAAATCGVNEKTPRRWLKNDEAFQADYAEARQATFEAGMGRIQALTARAVETFEDLFDAKKHPSVRLGAARTVAGIGIHQHDADTILRKLVEIEAARPAIK